MKRAKTLTEKEIKKVVNFINACDKKHAERNKAMLLLTYYVGFRVCEISSLKISDVVDENNNVLNIINLKSEQTKGIQSKRVFVNSKAKKVLIEYLKAKNTFYNGVYLFPTQKGHKFNTNALTQLFKRMYVRAGFSNASSHSGRRTFISALANKSVNVRVIAELVGHKNINTTQRYIEFSDKKLENAVELV